MTPLAIDQMKEEMPDIRPALAMPDLGDPALAIALDLPQRGRGVALDDQKQSTKFRVAGQVGLRQFMLAVAGLRLDEGNPLFGAEPMKAARKGPRHVAQMSIIKRRIVAVQVSPPGAQAASGLPQRKERVQHHTVDAVVGALQQLGVVLGKCVGRGHAQPPPILLG
jgi:hypothetical protein